MLSGSTSRKKEFIRLRLQSEELFLRKKHAWKDFHKILILNGFPGHLSLSVIRSKWKNFYTGYKEAKRTNNKTWCFYKLFDKYLGAKTVFIDKYDTWNEEWRLKLIEACQKCREEDISGDVTTYWRAVEKVLRSCDLPADCCVQDIRGLWQYLQATFQKTNKLSKRKGSEQSDRSIYERMLKYQEACELSANTLAGEKPYTFKENTSSVNDGDEFQWTRDITESFIQLRLQHEYLFKEKRHSWKEMRTIMVQLGYPTNLTVRMIQDKWAKITAGYQKAMATNYRNWRYYKLFQLYLGDSSLHLDPLQNWQARWVLRLIEAKTLVENTIDKPHPSHSSCIWRDVEKYLRLHEIPLNHTLLFLREMWNHLIKTYKYKEKFAAKGMLNESWQYHQPMKEYLLRRDKLSDPADLMFQYKEESCNEDMSERDEKFERKIKEELIEKVESKGLGETLKKCRVCGERTSGLSLFETVADEEKSIAYKLRVIGDVKVEFSDGLPDHICNECVQRLDDAYKFRIKCQLSDSQHRLVLTAKDKCQSEDVNDRSADETATDVEACIKQEQKVVTKHRGRNTSDKSTIKVKTSKLNTRKKYTYSQMCEVCGKTTQKIDEHMNQHTDERLYKCPLCDKKFKYKSGVTLHKVVHSEKPCKICQMCGKEFYSMSYYKTHMIIHSNDRKFSCETCGKLFKTKKVLKAHTVSHTDLRPHSCPDCGKMFRTAACVRRHRRIVHTVPVSTAATGVGFV